MHITSLSQSRLEVQQRLLARKLLPGSSSSPIRVERSFALQSPWIGLGLELLLKCQYLMQIHSLLLSSAKSRKCFALLLNFFADFC